ncbi:GNAT family N-acetyltransferase [Hathewaya histolytica]|uniref:GNAT family N-acetyltransferase n=1 Tax=Hathewaya histolytica TaxID=1498 RepID=UPI003B675BD7
MLKGNRVFLRSVERRDLNFYYEMWSDDEVRKFDSGFTIIPSNDFIIENFDKIMNLKKKHLTIVNEKGVVVGYITYEALQDCKNVFEIGITIRKDFRGRGYGKDSIQTLTKFLFLNVAAKRVELQMVCDNEKALNCYKTCGFIQEGVLREKFFSEGKYKDLIVMAMIEEDFSKHYKM